MGVSPITAQWSLDFASTATTATATVTTLPIAILGYPVESFASGLLIGVVAVIIAVMVLISFLEDHRRRR